MKRAVLATAILTLSAANAMAAGATPGTATPQPLLDLQATSAGTLADSSSDWSGKPVGQPRTLKYGQTDALILDGRDDYIVLADDVTKVVDRLPRQAFSAEAWVVLCRGTEWGSVFGAVRDNGGHEKGWLLGYNNTCFYLGLATAGTDDGNGRMTYLTGKTRFTPMRWHHVVATYDGARMALYVDGKLDAESTAQSADVLYPKGIPLVAGCYLDDNEKFPMAGAVGCVRLYDKPLSPDQVAAAYEHFKPLAEGELSADSSPKFVVAPYVQSPLLDRATIMCETDQPSQATVRYGTKYPLEHEVTGPSDQTIHEIALDGLEPETVYFYRVECGAPTALWPVESDGRAFRTAVLPDHPYAFTVVGDTQTNPDVVRRLFPRAYATRPNFQLHAGDVVGTGANKEQWVHHFLGPAEPLMSRVGVFPVLGNHEGDAAWYYRYFALPGNERWYAFRYGNGQFFMLDSNRDLSEGSEQYQWLDQQLADSGARWRFVVHHHPIYTSDHNDYGNTLRGGSPWGDMRLRHLTKLYDKHDVDIVFYGHIHMYERTWPLREGKVDPSGVRYINTGGGGGYLEQFAPTRNWFTARLHRAHHFCYLAVHGDTLEFQASDIDGRVFDSMTLDKSDQ